MTFHTKFLTRSLLCLAIFSVLSLGFDFGVIRPAQGAGQFTLTGKIIQVSDGDTINILVNQQTHRIRLASIDAPETAHGSARPGQPYGEASRKHLAEHVAGKTLTLICFEKDRYEREVCDVPVGDTTANRLQVQHGMAWANQQGGGKYLRDHSLIELEKKAKQEKLGLWAEPQAIAPWVWRFECWQKQKC
ncbi:MAG: thermonuclease family protein [Alcaligenaceae bacterium]